MYKSNDVECLIMKMNEKKLKIDQEDLLYSRTITLVYTCKMKYDFFSLVFCYMKTLVCFVRVWQVFCNKNKAVHSPILIFSSNVNERVLQNILYRNILYMYLHLKEIT